MSYQFFLLFDFVVVIVSFNVELNSSEVLASTSI